MAGSLLRRRAGVPLIYNHFGVLPRFCNFCSDGSTVRDNSEEEPKSSTISSVNHSFNFQFSPFVAHKNFHKDDYNIELVDPDIWRVSSSLAQSWRGTTTGRTHEKERSVAEDVDEMENGSRNVQNEDEVDFDDNIQDMRMRGKLFYKLDRDSREFEEYNLNFRPKKSSKKNKEKDAKESKKQEKSNLSSPTRDQNHTKVVKKSDNCKLSARLGEGNSNSYEAKKLRTQTYNQLTGPYHEPFCLDIYISKSSVRACIVHRVTSKVVVVAHSISKDMKFDLVSTKDSVACAAVGGALAQRALADDIHDVIYTPRKGEKLEGKLQTVLQSIIDNGINVKVKIKKRMSKKFRTLSS